MGVSGQEFAALLPAGLHEKSLAEFQQLCVDAFFPTNLKRQLLHRNILTYVLEPIQATGLRCNIWIDGSFLTEKIEPNDVDIVIESNAEINNNETALKVVTQMVGRDTKLSFQSTYLIDAYFLDTNDRNSKPYWLGQFGFNRSIQPKGILIIKLNGGV